RRSDRDGSAAGATGTGEERKPSEGEAEQVRARIAHEERGRTSPAVVEGQEPEAGSGQGRRDHRGNGPRDEPANEREPAGRDPRDPGRQPVHVVEQVEAV